MLYSLAGGMKRRLGAGPAYQDEDDEEDSVIFPATISGQIDYEPAAKAEAAGAR